MYKFPPMRHRMLGDWLVRCPRTLLGNWLARYPRTIRVFLLGVAALNGWLSYLLYLHHPQLAVFHGALAGLLFGAVILSWPRGGTP